MLAGLDQGAYILPSPLVQNNVLLACTAGAALLSLPAALLAALLGPLMVSIPHTATLHPVASRGLCLVSQGNSVAGIRAHLR